MRKKGTFSFNLYTAPHYILILLVAIQVTRGKDTVQLR